MASELKKLSKLDKPDNSDREALNASGVEAADSIGRAARASVQAHEEDRLPPNTHPANNGRSSKVDGAAPESPAARIDSDVAERPEVTDEKPSPLAEVDRFFDLVIAELSALRTRAEHEAIDRAVDLILDCEAGGGRVHVTGVGKSEYVARYAASLLSSTGTPAYFLHATECVHGSAGQLCKSDIAIGISKSGKTPELMSAVALLGEMGIRIIGVSADTASPLANASDVLLYAGVENEGGLLNLAPRISILAQNYVLCGLSVALEIRKGLTREQYAGWHPGGVLGRLARGD
jgi:D-arabinose 5-phosphate isomerase GutQ